MSSTSQRVRAAQGVEPCCQQPGSIDLWRDQAADSLDKVGSCQRCCQPVDADPLYVTSVIWQPDLHWRLHFQSSTRSVISSVVTPLEERPSASKPIWAVADAGYAWVNARGEPGTFSSGPLRNANSIGGLVSRSTSRPWRHRDPWPCLCACGASRASSRGASSAGPEGFDLPPWHPRDHRATR